jgi:hypothetical protein
MPEGAVYVGRPTVWSNPYVVGERDARRGIPFDAATAVERFAERTNSLIQIGAFDVSSLRGKTLACWCPLDQPCHADILLELANAL